ncbi:MAG: hypothetical protein Ct9H90mP25_4240 [Gammaproteobacteria bacterium]|nr:MAG: hypothetical protein Ct9H90mP25_4240 [Gammaproteobacteria bacterium]
MEETKGAWVRFKLFRAITARREKMFPGPPYDGRRVFAHLKLQAIAFQIECLKKFPLLQPICGKSEIDIKVTTLEALRSCFD